MSIQNQIKTIFFGKAFESPLFYALKDGLRFELSKGGSVLDQFLLAHQKATQICDTVFKDSEGITICLKLYGGDNLLSSLSIFRALSEAGIDVPKTREYWSEIDQDDENMEGSEVCREHYIAFNAPKKIINSLLWCACASDFGTIQPNPGVEVYLFNFEKRVMVFPYDDRGMDVVGDNQPFLKKLYKKFNSFLLEHDRNYMDLNFSDDAE